MRLECIIWLLQETSADDTGARAVCARGLLAQIDAEFVYLLQFFSEILRKVDKVSQQLQDKLADLREATLLISSLREDLADIGSSDLIEHYSKKVVELCETCNVSPYKERKRTRIPRRLDEFIVLEKTVQRSYPSNVHISIFYEVLNCLLSEIDRRFPKIPVHFFAVFQLSVLEGRHSCLRNP